MSQGFEHAQTDSDVETRIELTESAGTYGLKSMTLRQTRGLAMLILVGVGVVLLKAVDGFSYWPDPPPISGSRWTELADRIDPNTADLRLMSALPGLGDRKARELVAFRERMQLIDPTKPVFANIDDLMKVKGVGFAITRKIEPYLEFPTPTTKAVD